MELDGDDGPEKIAAALVRKGLNHHRAGRLGEAERDYRSAAKVFPDGPDALHYLGVIRHQRGDYQAASDLIGRALRVSGGNADMHANSGEALRALGRLADARKAYETAVALVPGHPSALFGLGIVLGEFGDHAGAEACYRRLVADDPRNPETWFALGNTLSAQGRNEDAVAAFETALRRDPAMAEAHLNLGGMLLHSPTAGSAARGLGHLQKAAALSPGAIETQIGLGAALLSLGRPAEALPALERAVALAPDSAAARLQLFNALTKLGRKTEARQHILKARAIAPQRLDVRWALACELPVVYTDDNEIEERRAAFAQALGEIEAGLTLDAEPLVAEAFYAVGSITNFYLAYQGRNDLDLQRRYGALVCRIMAAAIPAGVSASPPEPDGRIRIGFISSLFRWHTVARLFQGWIKGLDRRRFKIMVWHVGTVADGTSEDIARAADFYNHWPRAGGNDPNAFAALSAEIAAQAPQVLIYPDIGMDPCTLQLAALRLAPVQAVSWGHPVTTGLPTMDYFLSSELMEPENGDAHYSEKLVRLPGIGVSYAPLARPSSGKTRADFGAIGDRVLYLSCQSLFKYLPCYDRIFPAVARQVENALFVFIVHADTEIDGIFQARIARAFAAAGLDAATFCRFLPRLSNPDYYALNVAADVYLDTPGWSGGNTTLEAIAAGLPIVTLPGAFMRGRHSYAMLRMIGVEDTVARDVDDYIALAVRLGRDQDYRRGVRAHVEAGRSRLYNDEACVRGLEDFLIRAVAERVGKS